MDYIPSNTTVSNNNQVLKVGLSLVAIGVSGYLVNKMINEHYRCELKYGQFELKFRPDTKDDDD